MDSRPNCWSKRLMDREWSSGEADRRRLESSLPTAKSRSTSASQGLSPAAISNCPTTACKMRKAAKGLAGCALRGRRTSPPEPGLGALLVGGESEGALLSTKAWVFKHSTFQILDGGTISKGRRGAVLVPSADATIGQQGLLVGGTGTGTDMITQTELFDPR